MIFESSTSKKIQKVLQSTLNNYIKKIIKTKSPLQILILIVHFHDARNTRFHKTWPNLLQTFYNHNLQDMKPGEYCF